MDAGVGAGGTGCVRDLAQLGLVRLAVPSRSALRDEVPTSPRAFKEAQNGAMVHPYRVEAGDKESERHKRTEHGGWTGEAGTGLTLTLRRRAVSLAAWTS